MTVYKTVFDVTEAGWQTWPMPALGLSMIAAGFFLLLKKKASSRLAVAFLCFAFLWTGLTGWFTYGEYHAVRLAIAEGRTKFTEGIVERFTPMPKSGHALESFCIGGRCFTYSDFVVTTGFNNAASHGGPMKNGMKARVTYVGIDHAVKLRNVIIKLEIEDKDKKEKEDKK
ncbi:MAG: hypothetical protein ACAH80_13910 [Alphaproteobacteria bacterium]